MASLVHRATSACFNYLWSGWGAASSLLLFFAAWQLAADIFGPLVLPQPLHAINRLWELLHHATPWHDIAVTARRAISGFVLSLLAGSVLGIGAGMSMTTSMLSRPVITVLMGIPPVAWLILALLWFGMGDGTPVFTVFIACFPIIFLGALQGTRTLDGQLKEVALVFRIPMTMRWKDLYLPHIFSYLFPAWSSALGMSWKIVVMAELLSTDDGIGAALAVSRSHLDSVTSMAWILALISTLLAVEYILLEPLKRHVEAWREIS
ncbi:ABC transporter permease [Thalassolituus marinus]|uniref:ABC transporter permease subunit n=2 Tax=Thalassolituus TaxID=187492 RepID=A0ABS7ZQ06_9GAMM|nr:ABC transporter permease subunit [Thalassolituus marinus]MCA6063760.1 ABC transporter permease subunit [Thalassolituus marinus]